jgi:DNA-binding GntR family transcriptional regulator
MSIAGDVHKFYRTKEEFAYEVLRESILQCTLKPGSKLVMDHLSVELDVSPIPIRSALQRLQAEGLVEITPHTGAVVSPISTDMVAEVFALLETLERTAFQAAAEKAREEDLARLRQSVQAMDLAVEEGDSQGWSALNSQFHRQIAEVSGMDLLVEFTQRTLDRWDRLSRCFFSEVISVRMAQAQAEHRQVLALLEKGDVQGLEKLAERHNRLAQKAYQELIEAQHAEGE